MSPLRFKLTTAVINHLLKTFTVFSLVVGLSGCNENLKDCNGFWDKTFGREACSASTNALGSLPINTAQVMSTSPVDIAVIGETYSSPVGVVAMDPKNTFKSYKISRVSGTGSVPKIDTAGVLTWTPVDTEWGAHVFKVEVQGLEGEPQTHQFKIDVVKRKSQIDVLVGNEGGTFSDVEGRYLVEVKPESLADGSANIHLAVSELAYADGSFAVSPIVTGAKEGAINFLKAPESLAVVDTPISSVAKSINSRSVTKSDDSTFNWYLNINERNIREIDISSNAIRVNEYSSALTPLYSSASSRSILTSLANMPLQWSTIDQLERRAVVISKAFQFDGNCLSTPECNNYTKAPIILIHGFTAGDSVGGGQGQDSTWGSFGAELTKPRKDEPNPRGGHPVFELRWKTHMRFEEAAAKLAEYVDVVQRITKRKPILVAHSFGGIVASTYVAGLAERQEGDSWKTVSSRGDDGKSKVLMVVTLGSPLSGIADNAFITDTTKLTYGRDPQEYTINMCKSLTCWQAGATDVNGSLFQRLYKSLNVNINAGSIIKKLSNSWTSDKVQNAIDIPYYLLVGIKSPIDHVFETVGGSVYPKEYDAWNGGKSFQWEKLGDGLIGLMGQAAIPEDFAKSPYTNSNALGQIGSYDIANKLGGDFVDRLIKSRPDEMMSPYVIANRSYYFAPYAAHTTAHATDIKAHATYAEAHLPESRKVPFCADNQPPYLLNLKEETCPQVDHPLRHFIDGIFDTTENQTVASPNLKPKTLAIDLSTKSNPVVTKSVSSKAISENVWNTSITIIKKNVGFMRLYMVKTDSNGHLTFDFGSAIGLIESNPDLSQYVLDVVVGDGVRGRQISQRVDGLEKEGDINLTIQLDPVNAPLISTSGFVFDSNNKTQPIANAKVYLSLGINQDSSLVTKVTTSNTSRVVTTDATGKFSLANVSAGSYTVVVEKAGYKTKFMPNVEVGNGATITLYSGDAVVVPQPTISVSSISPVQAVLNQKTTFTLTGTGFVAGMAYTIADCDSVESISTTATQIKFACTPKGAIGVKTLTLKDKPAGTVLYTGQVTVVNQTTPVPTISVSSISPVQAVLNQKTTFTLTGTGFVTGMAYTIADCDNFESVSSSATQLTFACIPKGTTGVKALTLKDKPAGTVLYTGQVTVVNQTTPVPTIIVSSISPAQAVLNQKTTFTLTGTGFVAGMAYTIADCDSVESISTIATELKFACTPKGTIGAKALTVKDKPAGTVIYTGQVTVVNQVTPVPTISVSSISPTQAVMNQKTTFTLTGTGFVAGMTYAIADCDSVESISTISTELKFACTPNVSTGVKALTVKDKLDGAVIYTGQVTVIDQPVQPVIRVTGITPTQTELNKKTIFTLTGTGFVTGMAYDITDCDGLESISNSATELQFACTPNSTGLKTLTVKDKVDGMLLFMAQLMVNPPTLPSTVKVRAVIWTPISYISRRTTVTIIGSGFTSGSHYGINLPHCSPVPQSSKITSTVFEFSCDVDDLYFVLGSSLEIAEDGVTIYQKEMDLLTAPDLKPILPFIFSVQKLTPTAIFTDQKQIFTVSGSGFFSGLEFFLSDINAQPCEELQQISLTETEAKFSCNTKSTFFTSINDYYGSRGLTLRAKILGRDYPILAPMVLVYKPPVIDAPTTAKVGDSVLFSISTAWFSSIESIKSVLWSFGDGIADIVKQIGESIEHVFNSTGIKTVTATYKTEDGQIFGSSTMEVTVKKYSVTPTAALLNKKTTFTIKGDGFVAGMGYTIEECDGLAVISLNATEFKFACTPKGTPGLKSLILKDQPNGQVLYASQISVRSFVGQSKLNDTGITLCANETAGSLECTLSRLGAFFDLGQDAEIGRDAQAVMGALTKSGGGSVGFDFTKISATGQVLPNDAAAWQCVLDNNTGLMWQREFNDPHYNGNAFTGTDYTYFTYSWYNPDSQTNGGFAGSGDVADSTKSLVSRTNSNGMCGYNDWRLPTDQELVGIVDYGRENPSIDTDFFPETASKLYWTSSPSVENFWSYPDSPIYWGEHASAWTVDFSSGRVVYEMKVHNLYVRLVRPHQ